MIFAVFDPSPLTVCISCSWCSTSLNITGCAVAPAHVLTATGFVNGKGQFSTLTESTPLKRSLKNLSQEITWRPLGIWVKYNQNYFYLCPLFANSPTGQTRRRIFTHDGSNDADSRKDVPFGDFFILLPI